MFRKTVTAGFLLVALSGCFRAPVLPPKQVLQKTFFVSSSLDSFSFSAQATLELRAARILSGSAVLNGSVLRSGPWSADATLVSQSRSSKESKRVDGILRLRAPGNGILYSDVSDLSGDIASRFLGTRSGALADGWYRFALPGGVLRGPNVPSQKAIDDQVDAIEIVEDRTDPKSDVYEYRVRVPSFLFVPGAVDEQLALTGTLWIDRRSFRLQRAEWSGVRTPTAVGVVTFDVDVTFGSFNSVRLPSMPLSTGAVLPLETIFAIISE